MYVRNCWYVAAWAQEITSDTLLERRILDEPLLIWRRRDGSPVIMDNRCPHRHAPLSLGRREGDDIRCMYHGLRFDAAGRCNEVPGQARISEALCIRTYPAHQRGAWLWVWMGAPERADPSLIPETISLDDPAWHYRPGGYLHYEAGYKLICDNLLDFSHLSFVHEKTLGGSTGVAETRPIVQSIERGVRVTREIRNTAPPPYLAKFRATPFPGTVTRRIVYDFLLPGVLLMSASTKPTATPDDDPTDTLRFHSCQALTPATARTTHYFFMQAHDRPDGDPAASENLFQSLCEAFAEDRLMIEAQQRMIDRKPQLPMQPINADAALGRFRALLDRAEQAEVGLSDAPPHGTDRRRSYAELP